MNPFTQKLKAWLDTAPEKRDLKQGALLLLQLTNNKVQYNQIMRNPRKFADFIEYKLKRYLQFRLQEVTKEEVGAMAKKVELIAQEHKLDTEQAEGKQADPSASLPDFKSGRRVDHERLPAEVQALYVENADIMRRMRELHLKLRSLSGAEATCPDSDRYPFLKEIIALDKRYHENWRIYDSYDASSNQAEDSITDDFRQQTKQVYRQINLLVGRYRKAPSEEVKEQLLALYKKLPSPTPKCTANMMSLGILPH